MALFVFGAGATRGCSFVNEDQDPCLPPLDADFFTQLQRIQNKKHKTTIQKVMADVVKLFGPNFDVTLETVFTTLQHTIQMIETTGDRGPYRTTELNATRGRLEQAIAAVFEDSLTERDSAGGSKRKPRTCDYHSRFVENSLGSGDDIITFNYDCVLDYALAKHGNRKWNARYGYGFDLGARGTNMTGDKNWQPEEPAKQAETVHFFKLHGSLHFLLEEKSGGKLQITLKERPYTKQQGEKMHFSIIPPEWYKEVRSLGRLWQQAAVAIRRAKHIVFIGYSLPQTDLHASALFRTNIQTNLKSLIVVNPDRLARRRIRTVVQKGFSPDTKVLSFDLSRHFLALDRSIWET